MTPENVSEALRKFSRAQDAAVARAISRGLYRASAIARVMFRQRGIGRTVFGVKGSGVAKLINRTRVKRIGDIYEGGIKAKGLAAIQDQGGRTKPHKIPLGDGDGVLAFVTGGKQAFAKTVNHPGANMPAIPFLNPALNEAAPLFPQFIDEALRKAIADVGLAA